MRKVIFTLILFAICARATPSEQHPAEEVTLHKSFPDIVDQIKRAIAYLEVGTNVKGCSKQGTAFLIDKNGILATCYHTVFDTGTHQGEPMIPDTSRIYVKFHVHDKSFKAQVVICRDDRDIAILRIRAEPGHLDSSNVLPATFARVDDIREGVDVASTGYDLTQQSKRFGRTYFWPTTHRGIVSSVRWVGPGVHDEFLDSFQADMLVNKGASGSPIYLAKDGRVIGMNTGFMGQQKEGILVNYGLANCVPAWAISKLYHDWIKSTRSSNVTNSN